MFIENPVEARAAESKLPSVDRDEALDGLRAIAALMVVFYHCGVELRLPPFVLPGFSGVHLFFVLSGYLISRPFWSRLIQSQPQPSWRKYAVRRFVRIYPTYVAALFVFVIMRVAGHLHTPTLSAVLLHVLLIFNWGLPEHFHAINIVMWTLAIEVQFYVLLPIAASVARRVRPDRGRLAVIVVCVAFVLIGVLSRALEYSTTTPDVPRFRLPFSFLDLFAMGMFTGYLELTRKAGLQRAVWLRGVFLLGGLSLLFGTNYWFLENGGSDWLSPPSLLVACLYPPLVCAGFALVLLSVLTRVSARVPLLTSAPLVFLGQISYSMYLFHVGVGYFLLTRLPRDWGQWLGSRPPVYALVQLGPVVLVSYLVYRAVELPSLRWVERFSLRSRQQSQASHS